MTLISPSRRDLIGAAGAGIATVALGGGPAHAVQRPAPALSAADRAMVERASSYIQDLTSATGRFVQIDAHGTTTRGTLWLQRPGKARFAYDGPGGLLVVSDGRDVNISDGRLKTFESYPLSRTPLALLLAREVRLDRGVTVTEVRRLADGFSITARDAKRETLGRISLDFRDAPLALIGWTVTDVKGGQTRVQLAELTPVATLDRKLFVLNDPRRRVGRP